MSQMKARSFIWVSFLGMWFGTFLYVNAGSGLARIDSIADCYSTGMVLSLAGLAMLPWLLKWMERLIQPWCREAE